MAFTTCRGTVSAWYSVDGIVVAVEVSPEMVVLLYRIDPAYGSSAFGIVVTQWVDNHIQDVYCYRAQDRPGYHSN